MRWCTPAFDALYAGCHEDVDDLTRHRAHVDDHARRRAPAMPAPKIWQQFHTPVRLTSMTSRHSCLGDLECGPVDAGACVVDQDVDRARSGVMCSFASASASRSVTSAVNAAAVTPLAGQFGEARARSRPRRAPPPPRRAPASPRACANARPRPRLPPVTTATRPRDGERVEDVHAPLPFTAGWAERAARRRPAPPPRGLPSLDSSRVTAPVMMATASAGVWLWGGDDRRCRRPSRWTWMRSATSKTCGMSWLIRMTGTPRLRISRMRSSTRWDSRTPSAAVGSSMMITRLPKQAARATATPGVARPRGFPPAGRSSGW